MRYLFLAAVLAGLPAYAQENCAPHDVIAGSLAKAYGETLQTRMLQQNGTLVEVYANLETTTYTIVLTDATGLSCGVSAGDHYTVEPQGDPA